MSEKSQVRISAEADPTYCPYCMRCPGLVRMQLVEAMLWRCSCGAEHDERDVDLETLTNGTGTPCETTSIEIAVRRMREFVGEVAKHVKFVSLAPSMEAMRTHDGDPDRRWYDRYMAPLPPPPRAVMIGDLVHRIVAEEIQPYRAHVYLRWDALSRRRLRRNLVEALGWTRTPTLGGDIIHTEPA